jgi:hypothetical protein
MIIMSIARAISAVEDKGIDTDLELYEVIENSPGESVYSLAKLMAWSNGKTYASARRLERSRLVHITSHILVNLLSMLLALA